MTDRPQAGGSISATAVSDLVQQATSAVSQQAPLEQTLPELLVLLENAVAFDRMLVWEHVRERNVFRTIAGRSGGMSWNPEWQAPSDNRPFSNVLAGDAFVQLSGDGLTSIISEFDTVAPSRLAFVLVGPIGSSTLSYGALTLSRTRSTASFTDAEIAAIRSIAGFIGVAVQTALGAEAEQHQRQRAMLITQTIAALNQARTAETVAAALKRGVYDLSGVEHSQIVLHSRAQPDTPTSGRHDEECNGSVRSKRRMLTGDALQQMVDAGEVVAPAGMYPLGAIPISDGARLDGQLRLWASRTFRGEAASKLRPDDLETIQWLCSQAAVALERTRLQTLAQRSAQEHRALGQIATRLSFATAPHEMATSVLDVLATLVPFHYARISRCNGDQNNPSILGHAGTEDEGIQAAQPTLAALEHSVREMRRVWTGPMASWMDVKLHDQALAAQHVASWPLLIDADTVGTMTIVGIGSREFTSRELEMLEHTTSQLALGMQRSSSHLEAIQARHDAERHAASIGRILMISDEMTRRHDLQSLYRSMESGLWSLISHDCHAFYRADHVRGRLELKHSGGHCDLFSLLAEIPFGDAIIGQSARLQRPEHGIRDGHALLSVPMVIDGEVLGAITLWRPQAHQFDTEEASLLAIFGAHAASELRRTEDAAQRRELHLGGIRALASTVDMRDPLTRGHSERVHRLARSIAEAMRLPEGDIERIEVAALLHDVGKVGIPDAILQKPSPLDDHEQAVMMGHAELGADILRRARSAALEELIPLVRHHHERWDGRGYPDGLRGSDIPIGAQVIAVADAWDSMTQDRPYRRRLNPETAWSIIKTGSGTQFAPHVVRAFEELNETGTVELARADSQVGAQTPDGDRPLEDLRPLGILVELARTTSHLTNLASLLRELAALLARRLDIVVALIIRPTPNSGNGLQAVAQSPHGHDVFTCHEADTLDRILVNELPTSMDDIRGMPADPHIGHLFSNTHNTGVVPLILDDMLLGATFFEPLRPEHSWKLDAPVIQTIAPHVSAAINVARLHERARDDASTDGLTGASNYRGFHRELDRHLEHGDPFSLLMFDVVGLKQMNDTVGHLAGDELLVLMVGLFRQELPASATIARIGGDEFGVLLPNGDPHELGAQVQRATERDISPHAGHRIAVRYGWAKFPDNGTTRDELIHTADQWMYRPVPQDLIPDSEPG